MTTSPERPAEVRATEAAVPDDYRTVLLNRVSWGAVLAGVVTALVVQLLLNMLGIGIGLGTLSAAGGDNPSPTTLSVGAGLWWTLTGIIASFLGGAMAGRLSGKPSASTGGWHGVVAWAATTVGLCCSADCTSASRAGDWNASHHVAEMSWPSTKCCATYAGLLALAAIAGSAAGVYGWLASATRGAAGAWKSGPTAHADRARPTATHRAVVRQGGRRTSCWIIPAPRYSGASRPHGATFSGAW